jgi:hypothetical protein
VAFWLHVPNSHDYPRTISGSDIVLNHAPGLGTSLLLRSACSCQRYGSSGTAGPLVVVYVGCSEPCATQMHDALSFTCEQMQPCHGAVCEASHEARRDSAIDVELTCSAAAAGIPKTALQLANP